LKEAEAYNAELKIKNEALTDQQVFYDPKTGRTLSPYEVSGLAPMTSAKTGETVYVQQTIIKPKTNTPSAQSYAAEQRGTSFTPPTVTPASQNIPNTLEPSTTNTFRDKIKNVFFQEQISLQGRDEATRAKAVEAYDYYKPVILPALAVTAPVGKIYQAGKSALQSAPVISEGVTLYRGILSGAPNQAAAWVTNLAVSANVVPLVTRGTFKVQESLTNKEQKLILVVVRLRALMIMVLLTLRHR